MSTFLEAAESLLGANHLLRHADQRARYETDWRKGHIGRALAVARPADMAQTAALVRLAVAHGVPLVPQGGNTGLVGGSVPDGSGQALVVSLERLNRIRALDSSERLIEAEAGVTQANLIAAAEQVGLTFPVSLGARDSCQLGGNLATNAGGLQVVKYGMMRANVRGLEVVLPNGEVLSDLDGLRKDNRGYALRELFVGSEGTLGLITAAAVQLHPALPTRETLFVALPSVAATLALTELLELRFPDRLLSAELMPRFAIDLALKHVQGARDPFAQPHAWYGLFELGFPNNETVRDALIEVLGEAEFEDAVLAENETQRADFWRLRESLNHCQRQEGAYAAHDVGVRRGRLPDLIQTTLEQAPVQFSGVRPLIYGHLGDGSLHMNLLKPEGMPDSDFPARSGPLSTWLYAQVARLGGTFSAEHGVGAEKQSLLAHDLDAPRLSLMRQLKASLDPQNLMNPGKLV